MIINTDKIRFFLVVPAILLIVLSGCTESEQPQTMLPEPVNSSSKLVNYHPVLDKNVRSGDSMLADLDILIREGLIFESDMAGIGPWVFQRGGLKNPDSTVTSLTYREMLRKILVIDMSGDAEPCEGCNDSILIMRPEYSSVFYLGKGRTSLQTMLRTALNNIDNVPSEYSAPPLDQKVDSTSWRERIESFPKQHESLDLVVFGNAMILLRRDGKNVSDYSYGQLLAAVDQVKEMDAFEDVRRLFEASYSQHTQP